MQEPRIHRQRHISILKSILFLAVCFCMQVSVNASQNPGTQQPAPDSGSQQPAQTQQGTGAADSNPAASVKQGVIVTKLSSQGRTVTLTVNITKDSQASSGRIKIHYPNTLLRVTSAQGGKRWDLEDVNTGLSESGQNLVSYAWADMEKLTGEGNLLTVTWEAQDAANGQEIVVETEVAELYSLDERMTVNPDWIIDRLRPSFTTGSLVRTGDESNAAGLALLCLGSVLVMARLIRSKYY